MPRKKKTTDSPKSTRPSFHESLKGFDIKVNSFGEMESTFEIDRINAFLNNEVHDKKLESTADSSKSEQDEQTKTEPSGKGGQSDHTKHKKAAGKKKKDEEE
ncbi:MAG: hypothetical protein ABIQ02_10430 [Saprospiraceae bacterium]